MNNEFERYFNTLSIETQKTSEKEKNAMLSIVNEKAFGGCANVEAAANAYNKRRFDGDWLRLAAAGLAVAACAAITFVAYNSVINMPENPSGDTAVASPAAARSVMAQTLCAQALRAENWIYYANPAYDYSLCKIEQSTGNVIKLSGDKNIRIADIKDGWVFYTYEAEESTDLVKIKTDGSERTQLYQSDNTYLNGFSVEIEDDFIYIFDDGIYRAPINETKPAQINNPADTGGNKLIKGYAMDGGWIYYVEKDIDTDEAGLYKLRTDGMEQAFLCDAGEFALWDFIGISNGEIIMSEGQELCKISPDGKVRKSIHTFNDVYGGHMVFELAEGFVYFKEASEGSNGEVRDDLFRLDIGTGEKTFITGDADELLIEGEWVYYADRTGGGALNRIKTDGTQGQKIADGECESLYPVEDELYYTKDKVFYKINKNGTNEEEAAILNKIFKEEIES